MVNYYPGTSTPSFLPNNMVVAPAVVLQVFDGGRVNLNVFVPNMGNIPPVVTCWSVDHLAKVTDGRPHWDTIETPSEPLDLN